MTLPKLLVVSHNYSLTGAPIALFNVLLGLKSRYDIRVVSEFGGPLLESFREAGFDAHVIPNVISDARAAADYLSSFDVLLSNTLLGCISIHAAHFLNKPSVWYLHEGHFSLHYKEEWQSFMRDAFPLASRVVVPSQFTKDLYAPWLGNKSVDIVPYGVANQELPPHLPPGRPIQVLQLGCFEHRKAQDIAFAAFRLINDDHYQLHIVGHIMEPIYHQQVVSHFADVRQARFSGEVSKEQTTALLAECDLLIVPSRDEVTPMVILEAMALAKPVIAARICGIPEMIEDGLTGFLFEKENHTWLAQLIRHLGIHPELGRQVGLRARDFQRQHHTLERSAASFDRILGELLKK